MTYARGTEQSVVEHNRQQRSIVKQGEGGLGGEEQIDFESYATASLRFLMMLIKM